MAMKSSSDGSGAGQPAAPPGNAAKLAPLPLSELNKRSAKFGTWNVIVQQAQVPEESSSQSPHEGSRSLYSVSRASSVPLVTSCGGSVMNFSSEVDEYEYQWDGKKRYGKSFSCVFVSVDDPSEYCMGQMRWTYKSENKFHNFQHKLTDGLAFTMSQVPLAGDAKKQYIHSPIQTVVNVADTHFSPLLHSKENNRCPEPPATIADCSHLTNQQLFDVTALVKSVSAFRPVKDTASSSILTSSTAPRPETGSAQCRWLCSRTGHPWARIHPCGLS